VIADIARDRKSKSNTLLRINMDERESGEGQNLPLIDTDNTDLKKAKPFYRRFAQMSADQENYNRTTKPLKRRGTEDTEEESPVFHLRPTMVSCKPFHLHSQRLLDPAQAFDPGFEAHGPKT